MPAIAAIAVADGAATPVTHTFTPRSTNGTVAEFSNNAASTIRGRETLSVEVVTPKSASGANRVLVSFIFPTTATVNGVETVVRSSKVDVAFNFAQDSIAQERKNARVMLANFLASAAAITTIEGPEPIY
jgi:hypothetical protein